MKLGNTINKCIQTGNTSKKLMVEDIVKKNIEVENTITKYYKYVKSYIHDRRVKTL